MGNSPVALWLAPALTAAIVSYYAFALWWFLRREPARVLLGLLAVTGLSLALRLVFLGDYPAGLNADEPLMLGAGILQRRSGYIFNDGSMGHAVLLSALFQAPLAELAGPVWAIRSYSLVTSVLCVPVAYVAARSFGLRVTAGIAAAVLVATLPWSLFWGRTCVGGELTFHQLLMLTALCRIIGGTAGAIDAGIGGLGLGLLLYDYPVGRCLLALPLVVALLAPRRQRLRSLALLAIGVLCWTPYVYASRISPNGPLGLVTVRHDAELVRKPVEVLTTKIGRSLEALVRPVAVNGNVTVASAGMHPPLLLALAFAGTFLGLRRGAFLWGGFLLSLTPAIAGVGAVSAHRMMMAFPFIVLAAAGALNGVRRIQPSPLLVAVIVGIVSVQSVRLYFSDVFWSPESRGTFDADQTRLVQALPWDHKVIAGNLGALISVWGLSGGSFEDLNTVNWLPTEERVTYAFAYGYAPLEPAYRRLFGDERVRRFGRTFMVTLEPADRARLLTSGWAYRGRCGEEVTTAQVPFLFQVYCAPARPCDQPLVHEWSGVWHGEPSVLRLRVVGPASVTTSRGSFRGADSIDFHVEPGEHVTVSMTAVGSTILSLFVVLDGQERVPDLEAMSPSRLLSPLISGTVLKR